MQLSILPVPSTGLGEPRGNRGRVGPINRRGKVDANYRSPNDGPRALGPIGKKMRDRVDSGGRSSYFGLTLQDYYQWIYHQ
jgi:hypothetical protein